MMNKTIQRELDSLFDEWKTRLIVKDGILDENKYWESMPRIVFLLKEAYEDAFLDNIIAPLPENRSKGYAPCGNSYSFWRHVRGWQHVLETRVKQARGIIASNSADKELEPAHVAGIKETPVTGVGYVNVKKAVGKNTSDWKDLYNHARNDADLQSGWFFVSRLCAQWAKALNRRGLSAASFRLGGRNDGGEPSGACTANRLRSG